MNNSKIKLLELKYREDGFYEHKCAFQLCERVFYGSLKKKYCCDKCKQRANSLKVSMVNDALKMDGIKIKKAVRILLEIFKPDERGFFLVNENKLIDLGFPFDVPTTKIKIHVYNGEMNCFGQFCFDTRDNKYLFYKLD